MIRSARLCLPRPPPTHFLQVRNGPVGVPAGYNLNTIELSWENLSLADQHGIHAVLQEKQRGAWTSMSLAERKAIYHISFGEYGPRERLWKAGDVRRMLVGTAIGVLSTIGLWAAFRMAPGKEKPHTMTREYQEKMNAFDIEHNMDPITGINSKGYKGKGHIQ